MKKKGIGRICDIYTIAFFPLFAAALLFEKVSGKLFFLPILFIALCLVTFIFIIKSHQKYILNDGSVSLLFLLLICVQTATYQYFTAKANFVFMSFTILAVVGIIATPFILAGLILNQRKKKSK